MRRQLILSLLGLAAAASPVPAGAQDTVITIRPVQGSAAAPVRGLPRDVAEEVVRFFNAPGTLHFSGATRVPVARGIDGDVAVIGGPVSVAGRISGALMVINGDLELEPGAIVGGDVLVVGGLVRGDRDARIEGEVRFFRDPLRYRRDADTLVYTPQREIFPWRRPSSHDGESTSRFVFALGGTYNRVEGVPVVFGPKLNLRLNDEMRLLADARAILRSAEDFSLETGRMGYRVSGELRVGSRASNFGLGARAFDVVNSIEPWPLKDFEAGWASFLLHDDYRDWYRRRGWGAFASLRPSQALTFTVEGREEDHFSRETQDVWTLFNGDETWRTNPGISDGRYRTLAGSIRLDTRNDRRSPSSGVLLNAEVEGTEGTDITGVVDPTLVCITYPCVPASLADGKLTFQRMFLDARTYLRLTPSGRLNLRVAGGGKLGGDDLPLQHRLSVGFPDPLPGWGFREFSCGGESYAGQPALCDRAIVMQGEFRMHLGFDIGPDWANDWGDDQDEQWQPLHISGPDIVVFADAGRGWSVGNDPGEIPSDHLPPLSSFKTDIGLGLDVGPVGVYFAKSVGPGNQPVTFTVRLGRRF